MGEAGIYSVQEILNLAMDSNPLIEDLIWERDNVFIVGHEKAGKSILGMQIALALSSGQALFGEYAVRKQCTVLYVQTEGKLMDTKARLSEMVKVNEIGGDKLFFAYFPSVALDTLEGYKSFTSFITSKGVKPDIIMLDPLYHSMQGSLNDEKDARRMTMHLRKLGEEYSATIIVIHHTHKPIRTREGDTIDEGDDSIFGSFVWKAWADHTLLFKVNKGNRMRILSCNTQRSGKVLEREELLLIDKPYLSFERKIDEAKPYEIIIRQILEGKREEGATREILMEESKLSMSAVEKSLRKLIHLGEVFKDPLKRPVIYWSAIHKPVRT